ncbi:MAG: (2Fe-2S)-binding protein [bacterium]
MLLDFMLNGVATSWSIHPGESLFEALRRHGRLEVKGNNCGNGECGACTVLLEGVPVPSCALLAGRVAGKRVETVSSLGTLERLHPLQQAFLEHSAVQCGYCVPGILLSMKALLDREPTPSREKIAIALSGHLCRCTGYLQQIEAVEALGPPHPTAAETNAVDCQDQEGDTNGS